MQDSIIGDALRIRIEKRLNSVESMEPNDLTEKKEVQVFRKYLFPGIVLMAILVMILLYLYEFPVQELLNRIVIWIGSLGVFAPVVYAGFYLFGSVFLLPCFPLTIGAGFIFGFQKGLAIAVVSATIGAAGAFLVSRYVAREWIRGFIEKNKNFQLIDRAVIRAGWKIVILIRFATHIPYNFVNYSFGFTGINFWQFVFGTFIGRLPLTVLHTYIGSFSAGLVNLREELPATFPYSMHVYGLGWIATILVTFYIAKLAREAFAEKTGPLPVPEKTS